MKHQYVVHMCVCCCILLTLGFHASPVVWYFITYALSSSRSEVKDLHHSTCVLSLQERP